MTHTAKTKKQYLAERFTHVGLSLLLRGQTQQAFDYLHFAALKGNKQAQFHYGIHLLNNNNPVHAIIYLSAATGNKINTHLHRDLSAEQIASTGKKAVQSVEIFFSSHNSHSLYNLATDKSLGLDQATLLFSSTAALIKEPTHRKAASVAKNLTELFGKIVGYKALNEGQTHSHPSIVAIMKDHSLIMVGTLPIAVKAWRHYHYVKQLGQNHSLKTPLLHNFSGSLIHS